MITDTDSAGARPTLCVGVGFSAGGLQALEELFSAVKSPSGSAFLIVTHLKPGGVSLLPQILQRCCAIPVLEVRDEAALEVDKVYVASVGSTLKVEGLRVRCVTIPEGERRPVDLLFGSLAQEFKECAVGVVLSGSGADGSKGGAAIKAAGGLVIAQLESTAEYPQMPVNVCAATDVDYVLAPGSIPQLLVSHSQGRKTDPVLLSGVELPTEALHQVWELVRNFTGHDFSRYKASTLSRRVERRMVVHSCATVHEYVRLLKSVPNEADNLFKELLINVTSFFRDPEAFDLLKDSIIPRLLANKPAEEPFRAWVAGCSTGEEAYSLAIVLRECLDAIQPRRTWQVFATDLDREAIDLARLGVFADTIADHMSPERLERFFAKTGTGYQISREIREMVVFAQQNVIADPPFTNLDLLTCRNLLIYLESDIQQRLIPLFHYSLRPGGVLFLGSSESLGPSLAAFEPLHKRWKIFRRYDDSSRRLGVLPPGLPFDPPLIKTASPAVRSVIESTASQMAERTLAQHLLPPCVLMHERGDIVHLHGRTGLFLEPAPGNQRTNNIYNMAREGLGLELALAVRQVGSAEGQEVVRKGIRIAGHGQTTGFNLRVKRLDSPSALRGLFLVAFESARTLTLVGADSQQDTDTDEDAGDAAARYLKSELEHVKNMHQSTAEELETANEELKSSNEELQSTNEEFQSANEELETSKEEMHSLNDELHAVNAELQTKFDDLSRINDDMKNLLDSTDIATLFLDRDLNIKRYTDQTTAVIRVIPSDVGRPIGDLVSTLQDDQLVYNARQVLVTLKSHEAEVQSSTGRWYLTRILPYRTSDNLVDGLVITFVDITTVRNLERQSQRALSALRRSQTVLFEQDAQLRYGWLSGPLFGKSPDDLVGHTDDEIWPLSGDAQKFAALKGEVLKSGQTLRAVMEGNMGAPAGRFQIYIERVSDGMAVRGIVGEVTPWVGETKHGTEIH